MDPADCGSATFASKILRTCLLAPVLFAVPLVWGWREGRHGLPGSSSVSDDVLVTAQGFSWSHLRGPEGELIGNGDITLLAVVGVSVLFFVIRGRKRTDGGRSGCRVPRFLLRQRGVYWVTAIRSLLRAITGLTLLFGLWRRFEVLTTGRLPVRAQSVGSVELGAVPRDPWPIPAKAGFSGPGASAGAPVCRSGGADEFAPERSHRRRADPRGNADRVHGMAKAKHSLAQSSSGSCRGLADLFPLQQPDAHVHMAPIARLYRRAAVSHVSVRPGHRRAHSGILNARTRTECTAEQLSERSTPMINNRLAAATPAQATDPIHVGGLA